MTKPYFAYSVLIVTILTLFISCSQTLQVDHEKSTEPLKVTYIEAEGETPTAKLFIEGMTCERMCVSAVKKSMATVPSVTVDQMIFDVDASVDTLVVHFDPNKVGENELVKAIEEIAGGDVYHVKEIQLTKDAKSSSCTRSTRKKEDKRSAEYRLRLPNLFDMLKKVSI